MEDVQTIKRLLRNAFSEILSLSDRVVTLEEGGASSPKKTLQGVDIEGVVDLTAGAFMQRVWVFVVGVYDWVADVGWSVDGKGISDAAGAIVDDEMEVWDAGAERYERGTADCINQRSATEDWKGNNVDIWLDPYMTLGLLTAASAWAYQLRKATIWCSLYSSVWLDFMVLAQCITVFLFFFIQGMNRVCTADTEIFKKSTFKTYAQV